MIKLTRVKAPPIFTILGLLISIYTINIPNKPVIDMNVSIIEYI